MAVAGSSCSAYVCRFSDGRLVVERKTTTMSDLCPSREDAVSRLRNGETVTVAGADVAAVRSMLQSSGGNPPTVAA